MKNTMEILTQYTEGKLALEEANAQLTEIDSKLFLDPNRNKLTADEIAETTAGETPGDANGMGMLDTGTGTLDKVFVRDGVLIDTDCGEMYALCIIGGKMYHVKGNRLTE